MLADSSSDEDSLINEGSHSTPEHERGHSRHIYSNVPSDSSSTSSARDTPPQRHRPYNGGHGDSTREAITHLADVMQNLRYCKLG